MGNLTNCKSDKFHKGVTFANDSIAQAPNKQVAIRTLEQCVESASDFGEYDDFDRGIQSVLDTFRKGSMELKERS